MRDDSFNRHIYAYLNQWFDGPQGQRLMALQQAKLASEFRRLFSPLLVQIGGPADLIRDSNAAHKIWVTPFTMSDAQVPQVCARPEQIPLAGNSADAVLLLHTLDACDHPQLALREAVRVLRPGGTLLAIGFDPTGWMGLTRSLPFRVNRINWLRKRRLADWLGLLGCHVERIQCAGYPKRFEGLARFNAPGAGFYFMRVKKERLAPPNALRHRLRGRLMSLAGARSQAQLGRSVASHSVVVPFKRRNRLGAD